MCENLTVCTRTQTRQLHFWQTSSTLFNVFLQSILLNLQEDMRSHANSLCNLSKAISFSGLFLQCDSVIQISLKSIKKLTLAGFRSGSL